MQHETFFSPQSVAEAHATLSLPKTAVSRPRLGRWGHRHHPGGVIVPPSAVPSSTSTHPASSLPSPALIKPGTSGFRPASIQEDPNTPDISFSSSDDESDSDSPFPNSSDSGTETPDPVTFEKPTAAPLPSVKLTDGALDCEGEGETSADDTVTTKQSAITTSANTSMAQSENVVKETENEIPDGWNGSEVTMFRMLHPLFGHNYCTLAEMIRTKTCRELYKYGLCVSAELLRLNGEAQERQLLPSKKKKKNMR